MKVLQSLVAKIAAIGGVRRRGLGALEAYGGKIHGEGYVKHKSGPLKGKTTRFTISGQPAAKN